MRFYKDKVIELKRSSPNSLYDEGFATMEAGGNYNQTDAEVPLLTSVDRNE
jgi:argininosuccinate synthase